MKLTALLLILPAVALGADYYVAPDGSDTASGTLQQPFATLSKAATVLQPGDTCWLREGRYPETVTLTASGTPDAPITIAAYPGEVPLFDGTAAVTGPWRQDGQVWRTQTDHQFELLFCNEQAMLEARWPNTTPDKLFTREGWKLVGPKSKYQLIDDPDLAATGVDWTGATAVLNVAHQFWSWDRPVLNHRAGSPTFEYRIAMNEFHLRNQGWWDDDYYYLTNHPAALDAPYEWYLAPDGTLSFIPPPGVDPNTMQVRVKVRDYGVRGNDLSHVVIRGLHFLGCTFRFENAERCVVDGCHLRWPSWSRGVPDALEPPQPAQGTLVSGVRNRVANSSFAHAGNWGIRVSGKENVVENCLFHDINVSGTLRYLAIALSGSKDDPAPANIARGNTCYNVGNAIISCGGNRHGIVEYNHVHHGGLLSSDVSLLYTATDLADGVEMRYNWIHDSLSPDNSLGVRGDDKTRGLRVHHNVIWNIHRDGIVAKGGRNRVYNNTCFANGAVDIMFNSGREPDKWWQEHIPAYEHQNEDSLLINNATNRMASTRGRNEPGLPGDVSNNHVGEPYGLLDPDGLDFRPAPGSPLIDAGRAVEGITAPFNGRAPDIGAYEAGDEPWLPGHRNGVQISQADGRLQAALTMPIDEPVTVEVGGATLHYGPDNWMLPQPVAGRLPMTFTTAAWGHATVSETIGWFAKPDLSTALPLERRYAYEEVYQPAPLKVRTVHYAGGRSLPLWSIDPNTPQPPVGSAVVTSDGRLLRVAVTIHHPPGPHQAWGQSAGVELDLQAVATVGQQPVYVLRGFPDGTMEFSDAAGAIGRIPAQFTAQTTATGWAAEFAVPLPALGVQPDGQVQFNVGVYASGAPGGPWFALAPTGGPNYDVANAALLRLAPPVPAGAAELLTNGDFESATLTPWAASSNGGIPQPERAITRVQEGRDGGWCIKYAAADEAVMKAGVLKWTCPVPAAVKAGGTYLLSYDVRVEKLQPLSDMGSFNAYIYVRRDGQPGGNAGQRESMITDANAPWLHREELITVPPGVAPSNVSLQLHNATGTVWLDNVSLVAMD